jgi:hypothetical protein
MRTRMVLKYASEGYSIGSDEAMQVRHRILSVFVIARV